MLAGAGGTYFRRVGQFDTKEMRTMTVYTAHPRVHGTSRTVAVGLAGALAVTATSIVVVRAVDAPAAPVMPDPIVSRFDPDSGARDSWEGRIGPRNDAGGIRDSWMPPGMTDQELTVPRDRH